MASKNRGIKSRGWALTINNWTPEELEKLRGFYSNQTGVRYVCFSQEVGESGTPHLQVYINYREGRYFSTIKNAFPRAHIEAAKGKPEQNREYCLKEGTKYEDGTTVQGTFEEYGELPVKGDDMWREVITLIDSGVSVVEVIQEHPSAVRWIRQLNDYREMRMRGQ